MDQLAAVARDPRGYVEGWRARHPGRLVLGVLPMNFPRELALAAGTLPVVVQDDQKPVTEGRALLAEFYCGYTRNLADQAATGRFDLYDAVLMADHCIQLIGAADVVRAILPETPVFFGMLNSSMNDSWGPARVAAMMGEFLAELERLTGEPVTSQALRDGIAAHNRDRRMVRRLFDDRAAGSAVLSPCSFRTSSPRRWSWIRPSTPGCWPRRSALRPPGRRQARPTDGFGCTCPGTCATRRGASSSRRSRPAARWSWTTTSTTAAATSRPTSRRTATRSRRSRGGTSSAT